MTIPPIGEPLQSWDKLCKLYGENGDLWDGWLFRGQLSRKKTEENEKEEGPSLKTSLERAMERFGFPFKEARTLEYRLLRDFMRRCHLVTAQVPPNENKMEWLALLRHYGGPARLQDWTYSFWLALHFALERAKDDRDICEVWALDARWMVEQVKEKNSNLKNAIKEHGSNSPEESKALFEMKRTPGVWIMSPFRLNDRLAVQQGAFVLPLDVTKSLMKNFEAIAPKPTLDLHLRVYTITLSTDSLKQCFRELHQMNISRSTVYPGLEGLALFEENAVGMPHLFGGIEGDVATGPF